MSRAFDCLVVGAGLAGALAAVALSRAGYAVAVLERRPAPGGAADPDPDMRGLVVAEASRRCLAAWGVWERLAADATPVRAIHVTERGRFGSAVLEAREAGLEALGWAVPADVLLARLRDAAHEAVGEGWFDGTAFESVARRDAGLMVAGRRGTALETFETRLLVGADGSDSTVRTALGIDVRRFDYRQRALVANVMAGGPQPGVAFERFTSRGPVAMIPLGGARYVSVQCLDEAAAAETFALGDDDYAAVLQRRFGERLGALSSPGPRHAHPLVRSTALALSAERAVLIGNAASTVHPNGAQGWNLGVRDVAALDALLCGRPDDPGADDLTNAWAAARVEDHRRTRRFTDALARGFRSPLGAARAARFLGLALTAGCAPLRRRLMVEASGLAPLARTRLAHD